MKVVGSIIQYYVRKFFDERIRARPSKDKDNDALREYVVPDEKLMPFFHAVESEGWNGQMLELLESGLERITRMVEQVRRQQALQRKQSQF